LQSVAVLLFCFLTFYQKSFAQECKENSVEKIGWDNTTLPRSFVPQTKVKKGNVMAPEQVYPP
jgi:hypothetical protein